MQLVSATDALPDYDCHRAVYGFHTNSVHQGSGYPQQIGT